MMYSFASHQNPSAPSSSHGHHGGRRRTSRLSSQNPHRPFRGVRSMKSLTADAPTFNAYCAKLEACIGFEIEDDAEFCPELIEDDLHSMSSYSDRSSLSSDSPSSSPVQHHTQPVTQVSPPFALAQPFHPQSYASNPSQPRQSLNIHQPLAMRSRNAIPIVNPSTGMRVPSPPPSSVSPARMQQTYNVRQW